MIRSLIGSFDFAPAMLPGSATGGLLFSSVSSLLIWGPVSILAVLLVAGIVVWRTRRRWPVMAVLYEKIGKHPFAKYIVLSVVAHIALVTWLLSSSLLAPPLGPAASPVFVQFGDEADGAPKHAWQENSVPEDRAVAKETKATPKPWDMPVVDAVEPPPQELADASPEPSQPVERTVPPPAEPAPRKQVPVPTSLPQAAFAGQPSTPATVVTPSQNFPVGRNESRPLPDSLPVDRSMDRARDIAAVTAKDTAMGENDAPKSARSQAHSFSTSAPDTAVNSSAQETPVETPVEAPSRKFPSNLQQFASNGEQPKATEFQRLANRFNTPDASSTTEPSDNRFAPNQDRQTTSVNPQYRQPEQTPLVKSTPMPAIGARQNGFPLNRSVPVDSPFRTEPRETTTDAASRFASSQPEEQLDAQLGTPSLPQNTGRTEYASGSDTTTATANSTSRSTSNSTVRSTARIPAIYHDRLAPDRMAIARMRGGSANTERAVRAALQWLEQAQAADGRWNASQFGGGRPTMEGGHDRRGAGRNADTGISGLAVLAFLGNGHTHLDGEYRETVQRGVEFIVASQQPSGSLAGDAQLFAAMYCHGIACLALSEAYSLTADEKLLPPLQSALGYTLLMQHPTTGGWRYRRGESGDTSQLGWQLMSLTSAHYAGLQIPSNAWSGAGRFLQSVTSRDGLAAYRPRQLPSPAMTAEAMLCRLFLRTPPEAPQIQSAARYLLRELPGNGRTNYYYWYYGTLALYHLQDDNWHRWNRAVKKTLVGRQQGDGSWSADSVWGTSGGKVYATALGALTLEVYYRYRPLQEPNQFNARASRDPERESWRRN